jgi:hypothetical protein
MDHFFTHERCKTDQHVLQFQILEFGSTSFVHIAHSYCLFAISSCIRVAMSGAWDFDMRLARGCRCGWVFCVIGWPGTNSGASPASDPSVERGTDVVSWPPKALCPFTMGCEFAPPLRPPLPKPPRMAFLPRLGFADSDGTGPEVAAALMVNASWGV